MQTQVPVPVEQRNKLKTVIKMSVLKNVKTESAKSQTNYASKEYLGAKADFPINVQREMRIIDGTPSRMMYLGKNHGCRSFDGEVGKIIESGYKDERICEDCKYKYGFKDEDGTEYKCKRQYTLVFEHESDPEKVYVLTISYGAQKKLEAYSETLAAEGLSEDQVITGITRIENPDGPGTTYKFEKVRELKLEMSLEEEAALEMLRSRALSTGEPIPVKRAASVLTTMSSLAGISQERAIKLVESIAENDYVTGKR